MNRKNKDLLFEMTEETLSLHEKIRKLRIPRKTKNELFGQEK